MKNTYTCGIKISGSTYEAITATIAEHAGAAKMIVAAAAFGVIEIRKVVDG